MKILKFEKIESTQKIAKNLVEKGEKEWTVILAKEQTKGIGRKGNFWYSPRGGLYFSVILPKARLEKIEIFRDLVPFLISKVIFEEFGEKPFIKFPNDVYLRGKKIAGVIVQNFISSEKQISILGVGINTNVKEFPKDLREKASSLLIEFKKKVSNQKILEKILREIKKSFEEISK